MRVIRVMAGQSFHVLDPVLSMANISKAIGEICVEESCKMRAAGFEHPINNICWKLLKSPETLI